MMDSHSFLSAYFQQCAPGQWIELTFIHHDKSQGRSLVSRFVPVGDRQGLRDQLEAAADYNADGYGIYFGVCPRATLPDVGRRGSESHVDTIVGFWTELDSVKEGRDPADDLNKLQEGALPPSLCLLSGGGVQGYWLLPEPAKLTDDNRALIKSALRGLGKSVGGDLQVAEFARVLRVPGFVNTKPERNGARTALMLPSEKHRYQLGQLVAYAPPPELPRKPRDFSYESHDDRVELAQAALNAISPSRCDEYELWTYVGMALRELGSVGLSLWEAWSSRSSKYRSGECDRKWNTFDEHGYNLGSLCKWANEDTGGTSWRPIKIDLTPWPPANTPTIISTYSGDPDWVRGLSTGERGGLNRYGDRVLPVILEIAASVKQSFDIAYLVCMTVDHGISERAIRNVVDRLPVVFLHSQDDPNTIPERESGIGIELDCKCAAELRIRKSGRPAQLYALADRATVHAEIVRMAIPQIIKEAFPKKNNTLQLAPPIHAAFLEELGLDADEAELRAKELDLRYGADLRAQPGWREAMQEVRKRVRDLKAQLLSTDYAPLPAGAVLDKRPSLLAAAAKALISFLGGAFQMGRAKLCALIGCRDKELASVCRNAGIVIDKNAFALKPVQTLPELLAIPQKFDPKMGGFPVSVQSTFDKKPMALTSPKLTRWATDQIIAQGKLCVRYRLANHYRLAESVIPPVETPITEVHANNPKPVQQPLFAPAYVSHDTFPRYILATLRFGLIARTLNALIMAWSVAKEAAWHIHQHADRIVPYAEAVIRKIVDVVTPWQPRGDTVTDRTTGEVKTFSVQLGFDLLLESEDTCKPSTLTSTLSGNGAGSCAPLSPPGSRAPGNTSFTLLSPTSGPTRATVPRSSRHTENITMNTNVLALEGT